MRIVIFGASGGTGRQLVAQALAAGHEVTAFSRHADTGAAGARLTVIAGDTTDAGAVDRAVAGRDAVLCALGGRPWRRRERVCSTAMRHIVAAMKRHGVRRVVAISTFGAGNTRPLVGRVPRTLLFGLILRSEVVDKEAMEDLLSATDLDWTVVRVGILGDAPARHVWRAADDDSIRGMGKIARADVAEFMLAQLASDAWLRRRPALMY
jgi:putative NADH-flavin reductase